MRHVILRQTIDTKNVKHKPYEYLMYIRKHALVEQTTTRSSQRKTYKWDQSRAGNNNNEIAVDFVRLMTAAECRV